jgi:hypothetical protein
MKKFFSIVFACSLVLSASGIASATSCDLVYETTFCCDPGWTTNAPDKMYWDSQTGTYHLERDRDGDDEYAYVNIPYNSDFSYRFEFDIKVVRSDWAGEIPFGLGDGTLTWDTSACQRPTWWGAMYSHGDGGYGAIAAYVSDIDDGTTPGYGFIYELDTWYHNLLIYDKEQGRLLWQVTNINDGSKSFEIEVNGSFDGIDRIFCGSLCVPSGGGTGEAYIDNISLCQIPEPTTLLLLGLGGLTILRKRRVL